MVGFMYIFFYQKRICVHLFTMKEYITVELTSTVQKQ